MMSLHRVLPLAVSMAVMLSACSFQTLDIRRPLTVRVLPHPDILAPLYAGREFDSEKMLASMQRVVGAIGDYDVNRYDDWGAFIAIRRLADALTLAPDNPFAWVQLGAQLALNHQMEAAIRATDKGILIIDELCPDTATCPHLLRALRSVAAVNLAMYFASEHRALEASFALNEASPDDLPGIDKLAYYWTATDVHLQFPDVERAAEFLAEAKMTSGRGSIGGAQFLGSVRQANEHLLEAAICAADPEQDQLDCALSEIDRALETYPELWDAYLLRANIQYDTCDFDGAIRTLQELRKAPRRMVFHAEKIPFNLGNAFLARYTNGPNAGSIADLESAARAFADADKIVRGRAAAVRTNIEYAGALRQPETVSAFFIDVVAETPAVYADALNNLGEVELLRGLAEPKKSAEHFIAAERHWHTALQDRRWPRRQIAWANLTRLYCAIGRTRSALEAADESLQEDPYNIAALEALAFFAARTSDDELSARISEGIARLVWARQERYGPGSFDALLEPILHRFSWPVDVTRTHSNKKPPRTSFLHPSTFPRTETRTRWSSLQLSPQRIEPQTSSRSRRSPTHEREMRKTPKRRFASCGEWRMTI